MTIKPHRKIFNYLFFLILLGFMYLVVPGLSSNKEQARVTNCFHNLKQIISAIDEYKKASNNKYPENLKELFPKYLDDEYTFHCPTAKINGSSSNPSYLYIKPASNATPDAVILLDDNHPIDRIVGYKRGGVKIIDRRSKARQLIEYNVNVLGVGSAFLIIFFPWILPLIFLLRARNIRFQNQSGNLVMWWILTVCLILLITLELLWYFSSLISSRLYSSGGLFFIVSNVIALGLTIFTIFLLFNKLKQQSK